MDGWYKSGIWKAMSTIVTTLTDFGHSSVLQNTSLYAEYAIEITVKRPNSCKDNTDLIFVLFGFYFVPGVEVDLENFASHKSPVITMIFIFS